MWEEERKQQKKKTTKKKYRQEKELKKGMNVEMNKRKVQ